MKFVHGFGNTIEHGIEHGLDSSALSPPASNDTSIKHLESWNGPVTHTEPTDYSAIEKPRHQSTPFACSHQINKRLILWTGDISRLDVDAITSTSDETLTERNRISELVFWRAGSQLRQFIDRKGLKCRTGEVQVTPGFNLPAKHIIHTVGPIYSEKYKTASENSLSSCYRNVFCSSLELSARSLAVCVIYSAQRNFPPDIGAHIALRTTRRFLEVHKNKTIVLCVDQSERGIYNVLTPLYFPRNSLEERSALWQLPKNIGGEFGEPVYPERQIRIIKNPQHCIMNNADDDSDSSPHDFEGGNIDLEYGLSSHMNIGQHAFSQMQGDLDRQRLLGDRPRVGVYESVVEDGLEGIDHQER